MGSLAIGLSALVSVICVGTLIGAVLLLAACKICRAEEPSFGRAWRISVAAALANSAVGFVIFFAASMKAIANPDLDLKSAQAIAKIVTFGVSVPITTLIYRGMIPTSFGKAILVYLVQVLIIVALAIPVVLIIHFA